MLNTRRQFLQLAALSILARKAQAKTPGLPDLPHFPPTAKRVIYLFQSGGPSQLELFDHKPRLTEWQGTDLPDSIRGTQRLTGMSAPRPPSPSSLPSSTSNSEAVPAH